jgi:hypothetical protein
MSTTQISSQILKPKVMNRTSNWKLPHRRRLERLLHVDVVYSEVIKHIEAQNGIPLKVYQTLLHPSLSQDFPYPEDT